MKTDEHAVVAGCATGRGPVSCAGREHQLRWADGELRVPGHPDLESEKILRALAGESYACLDVLEAWQVHADDLRVLVLASRGPADPVAVRPEEPGPTGWTGWTGRAAAARMQRRRSAVTAVLGGGAPASREREDPLATLLSLGGPMQTRLTATVAAAWRERLRDGAAAPADAAGGRVSGPAGAARGAVRPGGGHPAGLDRAAGPPGRADHDRRIGPAGPGPRRRRDRGGTAVRLDQRRVGPGPGYLLGSLHPGRGAGRGRVGPVRRGSRPGPARARSRSPAPRPATTPRIRAGFSACAPGGRACGRTAGRRAPCPRRPRPGLPVTSDGAGSGTVPREPARAAAGAGHDGVATGSRCTHCVRLGARRPPQRMTGRAHHAGQFGHHRQARAGTPPGRLGRLGRRPVVLLGHQRRSRG